jgi:hypothetical protein
MPVILAIQEVEIGLGLQFKIIQGRRSRDQEDHNSKSAQLK